MDWLPTPLLAISFEIRSVTRCSNRTCQKKSRDESHYCYFKFLYSIHKGITHNKAVNAEGYGAHSGLIVGQEKRH